MEYVGGENISPREVPGVPMVNDSGFVYDPKPYKKLGYNGTDDFVHAKLAGSSQGNSLRKANSMIRLNKNATGEDVINKSNLMSRSGYGKNFRVNNNFIGGRNGYNATYDPEMEPGLGPQDDLEENSA